MMLDQVAKLAIESGARELASSVWGYGNCESSIDLSLMALTHGNEVGGLGVILRLVEAIKERKLEVPGSLAIVLGNIEAFKQEKRFVESDLNRAFGIEHPQTLEHRRAKDLAPILARSQKLLDFHQTIMPSKKAFFIFPFSERAFHWSAQIDRDLR